MALAGSTPAPAAQETMVVVAHARVVGTLRVRHGAGGRIALDYAAQENGRGPTAHEDIHLDPQGVPRRWTITATSILGAPVHETMRRQGTHINWVSDADRGSRDGASLYLANAASPYALGIYARAALRAPGLRVALAPSGDLRVEDLGSAPARLTGGAGHGRIYRLSRPWMEPRYVALTATGRLLAATGEGTLVRKGHERSAAVFDALVDRFRTERMRSLQARLAHRIDGPVHIRNVRIFDPVRGTIGPPRIVTIFGDRIAAIEPDAPGAAERMRGDAVIDGEGGTLIPGLRDMHSHTTLESGLFNLAAGVTSTRDMGNDPAFLNAVMAQLASGELPGPRITAAGFIEGVSPYSSSTGILAPTLDDATRAIRWYAWHGYHQIKIYNSIPRAWVKPMAAEAHRLGLGVVGHVPAFMTADQAIRDGYDEIAHVNQVMFQWVLRPEEDTRTRLRITALSRLADVDLDGARVAETLALMRSRGTALDTTISTQERLALSRAGVGQRGEFAYLDHFPIAYLRYRKRDLVPLSGPDQARRYAQAVDGMVALIGRLHAQGTPLMPGTDDPYGFPLHRELELYVLAGISPAEVLAIDVLRTARYLGQDHDLGSIERGKLADLVLLPGAPTRDIALVRRARMVMRGGVLYFPDEIYTALGLKPFATRPQIVAPHGPRGPSR